MKQISIGMDRDADGDLYVVLKVDERTTIWFGENQALLYGNALCMFGRAAKEANAVLDECDECDY
jgi:hypothetical protein